MQYSYVSHLEWPKCQEIYSEKRAPGAIPFINVIGFIFPKTRTAIE